MQKSELILISGSGRNVGKTTLACSIIEKLSGRGEITAVKISKHIHPLTDKQQVIVEQPGLMITEELDCSSSKDSSRYLRAGAQHSLFVQVCDDAFPVLSTWIQDHLYGTIVCETGYLGYFMTPKMAFYVDGISFEKKNDWNFPYLRTYLEGNEFYPSVLELLTDKI